jgi:predicted ATP-grasp superfamily ATP-dependent carboligase
MNDVLLTYGWVRSTYAALRNLSAHGLDVTVADSYRFGMCQSSRLKKHFVRYPSHYDDENAFVDEISNICEVQGIRLLMPSHNETEILARHRDRFPGMLGSLLPKAEHCALFNNKARSYEFAHSAGIPVPERIIYTSSDQIAEEISSAGITKTVIKLLTGNSAKGVFYAETPAEAQEISQRLIEQFTLPPERFPQVEERIYGEGWGCSALYWHGEPITFFCHRRLREKIATGGTSTFRESAQNQLLQEITAKLLGKIGWHGLAMVEYKICPETGRIWFIEVNPRLWGSIPLAISAGVEFPYLAWLCATEGPDAARSYQRKSEVRYPWRGRWLLGDMMLAAAQCLRLRPIQAWRTIFSGKSDSFDDLYLDDPLAFAGEILHYGSRFLSTLSVNPAEKGMVG